LLRPSLVRSWVERDLQVGDLRILSNFALFRNACPPSAVVDRLCERGISSQDRSGALPHVAEGLDRCVSPTYFCATASSVILLVPTRAGNLRSVKLRILDNPVIIIMVAVLVISLVIAAVSLSFASHAFE
jgi:hypothetical protein